tara:strand:+ start:151 stop:1056 length:906 start_codon:yes stop_codon:yes gene_type:complete
MSQENVQVKREQGIAQENALSDLAGAATARAQATQKNTGKQSVTQGGGVSRGQPRASEKAARILKTEHTVSRAEHDRLSADYDDVKSQLAQAQRLLSVFGIRTKRGLDSNASFDAETLEEAQKVRRIYDIAAKHSNGAEEVYRRFKLFDSQLKHRYQDTVLGQMGLAADDIVCINWNITSFGPNMYSMASVEATPNPDAPCELFVSLLLRPNDRMNVLPRCSLVEKMSPKNYEIIMNKVFDENNLKLIYNDYVSALPAGQSATPYATFKSNLWNDTQRSVLTRYQELRARSIATGRNLMGL